MLHVAVGVIRSKDSRILIAKRPSEKHQGGLWEFPGGKVDNGEDVIAALKREFMEELDITISKAKPMLQIEHHYSDRSVLLDVFTVLEWSGDAKGMEGQAVRWINIKDIEDYAFPEANKAIIKSLKLPNLCCITPDHIDNSDVFLQRLDKFVMDHDCMVQFRSFSCADISINALFERTSDICLRAGKTLVLNSSLQTQIPDYPHMHWNTSMLMSKTTQKKYSKSVCGASCHNSQELQKAESLNLDYALLGPVKMTQSHPEKEALGWEAFRILIKSGKLPVFALGGLSFADAEQARKNGAQGIAMIRGCW